MSPAVKADFLSPTLFDQYTAAWVSFISSASSDSLQKLFAAPGGGRQPFVSLSQQQLVWLLSTPNLHHIKVRFLLVPASNGTQAHFSAALYAADETGLRTSAYFLAAAPEKDTLLGGAVPTALANTWISNWTSAKALLPAMFFTNTLPLEGYNYEVADFMDPLFATKSLKAITLRLNFGLHIYYSATDTADPSQLFGLVLRLRTPDATDDDDTALYDLGHSVPPGN